MVFEADENYVLLIKYFIKRLSSYSILGITVPSKTTLPRFQKCRLHHSRLSRSVGFRVSGV